jgi:hypothetical protein
MQNIELQDIELQGAEMNKILDQVSEWKASFFSESAKIPQKTHVLVVGDSDAISVGLIETLYFAAYPEVPVIHDPRERSVVLTDTIRLFCIPTAGLTPQVLASYLLSKGSPFCCVIFTLEMSSESPGTVRSLFPGFMNATRESGKRFLFLKYKGAMVLFMRVVTNAKPLKVSKKTVDFIENKLPLLDNQKIVQLEELMYATLLIPPIRGPDQHIVVISVAVRALLFIAQNIKKRSPILPDSPICKSAAELLRGADVGWSE